MLEGLRSAVQSPAVAGHEQHSQGSIVGPTLFSVFMNTVEKKGCRQAWCPLQMRGGGGRAEGRAAVRGTAAETIGPFSKDKHKAFGRASCTGKRWGWPYTKQLCRKGHLGSGRGKKNHDDLSAALSSAAMKVNCPLGCGGKTGTSRVRKAKALVRINQLQLLVPGTRQTPMHPSKPNKACSKRPGAWTQHTEGLREPGLTQS